MQAASQAWAPPRTRAERGEPCPLQARGSAAEEEMALVRVLLAANAPQGELQRCTAQGLGRGEPERSGPARRGV
eukprot:14203500-Alexandrium_andersonii.AAC.1